MQLQSIQNKIFKVRDQRIMLDFDLAILYEVETRVLNQAVKRNIDRFPERFMFQLTPNEWGSISSQNVMRYPKKRPKSAPPLVFTEHGVTMLSSILRSKRAIQINISIIDAFIALKKFALNYKELGDKLAEIESRYDKQIDDINEALKYLLQKDAIEDDQKTRKKIGFIKDDDDQQI